IGAAHRRGVTHLDIRPENIVVQTDGFVLTGFELAAASEAGDDDLYCTAFLLYQALTNRLWPEARSSRLTRWSGVPRRLRAPLARALESSRAKRWPDAPSFASALEKAGTRSRVPGRMLVAGVAAALVLVVSAWWPARAARPPAA